MNPPYNYPQNPQMFPAPLLNQHPGYNYNEGVYGSNTSYGFNSNIHENYMTNNDQGINQVPPQTYNAPQFFPVYGNNPKY